MNRRILPLLGEAALALCALGAIAAFGARTGSYDLPKWFAMELAVLVGSAWLIAKGRRPCLDRIDLAAGLVLGWMVLSIGWSPDRLAATLAGQRLLLFGLLFWLARRADGPRLTGLAALVAGTATALVLCRAVTLPGGPWGGYGNENFETEALLALMPFLALGLTFRRVAARWACGALLVAAAVRLLWFNPSRIEFLVGPLLVLSGIAIIGARRRGIRTGLAALSVAGSAAALAAVALGSRVSDSVLARLELYANVLAMWLERPIAGFGIGAFGHEYQRFQARHFDSLGSSDTILGRIEVSAGAAHNDYLQLLAESGLVGAALAGVLLVLVLRAFAQRSARSPLEWAALAGLLVILAEAVVEFPLQNPPTAAIAAFCLARCAPAVPGTAALRRWHTAVLGACWIAVTAALGAFEARHLAAQRSFALAKYQHERHPGQAFRLNERAVALFPFERAYRRQLYPGLYNWTLAAGRLPVAEAAADRAFAVSEAAIPYAPGLLVARIGELVTYRRAADHDVALEALLARLRISAPRNPETFLLEAEAALALGDPVRARRALASLEALAAPLPGVQAERRATLERRLRNDPPPIR